MPVRASCLPRGATATVSGCRRLQTSSKRPAQDSAGVLPRLAASAKIRRVVVVAACRLSPAAGPMSRTELAQPSALLQHDVDLKAHLDSLHTSLLYNLQALAQHNRERRRDLNEEQQAHAQEVDRLQTQLSAARTKAQEMLAQIEAEQRDIKSASNAVASLQLRERALNDSLALSEADVQEMSTKLDTRQSELDRHRVLVRHHASLGAIELKYLQQATGLSIKPTEHGQVKIEFRLVDPADFARPFSLILATTSIDRSMPKYAIVSTSPPLDRTLLGTQEAALNRSRELGPFLAAMRRSFVASVEADRAARTS